MTNERVAETGAEQSGVAPIIPPEQPPMDEAAGPVESEDVDSDDTDTDQLDARSSAREDD